MNPLIQKGALCSVNGTIYEKAIHRIVEKCTINGKIFNTQLDSELGGSSSKNDIECNYNASKDVGIEAKKYNTPDWMQCSIVYDEMLQKWSPTTRCKIPDKSRELFNDLMNNDHNIFNGEIPPFMKKQITHQEWIQIKKETDTWNDYYFTIPGDTIRKLYKEKGCQYIQISNGYGLYHLGVDICNFNVPVFEVDQHIRIRTKIHKKNNKKGFCKLSVTMSCQPKNIKSLTKSSYSLDSLDKLPPILVYNNNADKDDDITN